MSQDLDTPPLHHIIIDTGAIIKGSLSTFRNQNSSIVTNYWTVAEVLGEVKDSHAKEKYNILCFAIIKSD